MFCNSCGNNNDAENRFCIDCGKPLLPANAEPAVTQSAQAGTVPPLLLLKVANAFVDDYIQHYVNVKDPESRDLKQMMESLKNFELSLSISQAAASIDPGVKLEDGTTPRWIEATLYQRKEGER